MPKYYAPAMWGAALGSSVEDLFRTQTETGLLREDLATRREKAQREREAFPYEQIIRRQQAEEIPYFRQRQREAVEKFQGLSRQYPQGVPPGPLMEWLTEYNDVLKGGPASAAAQKRLESTWGMPDPTATISNLEGHLKRLEETGDISKSEAEVGRTLIDTYRQDPHPGNLNAVRKWFGDLPPMFERRRHSREVEARLREIERLRRQGSPVEQRRFAISLLAQVTAEMRELDVLAMSPGLTQEDVQSIKERRQELIQLQAELREMLRGSAMPQGAPVTQPKTAEEFWRLFPVK